jgi:hypothetical protein
LLRAGNRANMTLAGREIRLSESEDNERFGGRAPLLALAAVSQSRGTPGPVAFNRQELTEILQVYGRKVAAGEWRDYAIDHRRDEAVFSVFRRSTEMPLYRIVKEPRLARRQGAYSLVAATGLILKRGNVLANVLRVLEKPVRLVEV